MTSETYGGGAWDNPDHHARPPRPAVPAIAPAIFCEAVGPDGWTCDREPHRDDRHKADEGPSWGADWVDRVVWPEPLDKIHALARRALENQDEYPDEGWGPWESILREILELSRG